MEALKTTVTREVRHEDGDFKYDVIGVSVNGKTSEIGVNVNKKVLVPVESADGQVQHVESTAQVGYIKKWSDRVNLDFEASADIATHLSKFKEVEKFLELKHDEE